MKKDSLRQPIELKECKQHLTHEKTEPEPECATNLMLTRIGTTHTSGTKYSDNSFVFAVRLPSNSHQLRLTTLD